MLCQFKKLKSNVHNDSVFKKLRKVKKEKMNCKASLQNSNFDFYAKAHKSFVKSQKEIVFISSKALKARTLIFSWLKYKKTLSSQQF